MAVTNNVWRKGTSSARGEMRISSDFVIWRWVETPIRILDLVFLGLIGLIFLIQVVRALIGPNELMALAYILAGVAK